MLENTSESYLKGRGAQFNSHNHFDKHHYVTDHIEGLDEPLLSNSKTQYFQEFPKKIVNKVDSPDLGFHLSMNPYQGCEHGCIYCYARNSHQYWGYSAGLDFERKIIFKENAPELLEKLLDNPKYTPEPIMLSGNTDCYQPLERTKKITRKILEILLKYRNPVGIITKNSLILRDLDLLKEMASMNLVHVNISITSLSEETRSKLEPRTSSSLNRLKTVELLSKNNIPVNIMIAPIIPSINNHEIPTIIKSTSELGALSAAYTVVRLNGAIKDIFEDWVRKNYEDRAEKILNQIKDCHGGKLNDSRFGTRMSGEGNIAKMIEDIFQSAYQKYLKDKRMPAYELSHFKRPEKGQLKLF